MERRTISVDYSVLSWEEINTEQQELFYSAKEAAQKAYSPYSGFSVGAALRLEDNTIIVGNNQENAAFPSGLCAERVALFWANANYPNLKVVSMAIVALKYGVVTEMPISPCGACRQVMTEVSSRYKHAFEVFLVGKLEIYRVEKNDLLFPLSFSCTDL